MATKAKVVGQPYIESGRAYLTVRVDGDGGTVTYPDGRTKDNTALEYTASTPVRKTDGTLKTKEAIKADLVASLKDYRSSRLPARTAIDLGSEIDL